MPSTKGLVIVEGATAIELVVPSDSQVKESEKEQSFNEQLNQLSSLQDLNPSLAQFGLTENDIIQVSYGSSHEKSRFIAHMLRGRFCYDLSSACWMKFNGIIWEKDTKSEYLDFIDRIIRSIVNQVCDKIFIIDRKTASQIRKFAILLSNSNSVQKFCDNACKGAEGIGLLGEWFDVHLRYIGAQNGVIDLETGQILPGSPDFYITKSTGFNYNPDAAAPVKFLNFLSTVFRYILPPPKKPNEPVYPDKPVSPSSHVEFNIELNSREIFNWDDNCKALRVNYNQECIEYQHKLTEYLEQCKKNLPVIISFLQRLFGYIILGSCKEHILLLFYGSEGRNGKGVLIRTLMAIFKDYGGEIRPEILLRSSATKSSSSPTPDILDLKGKRFVAASETNQGEMFDASQAKRLTGGDAMVGRALYAKSEVRFTPSHTLALQTNNIPNAPAEDTAFWRRLIIIHFNSVFVDHPDSNNIYEMKIDKDLQSSLIEEGSEILKWIVDGARLYAQEGLNIPDCLKAAVQDYRSESDYLGDFIEECCVNSKENEISASEFCLVFNKWLTEHGYKQMNAKTMADKMKRRGISKIKRSSLYYEGLQWSDSGHEYKRRAEIKAGDKY